MAPKNRDPRSYVKTTPLPIPSHQGMHIQARSETVYNCSSPTREAVFRENYARRRRQLTEQGYNAVSYKRYECVGDRFFLNEKKMILHALGQLENPEEVDDRSSSDDEEKEKEKERKTREQQEEEENQAQPKAFILRRKSTKNKKTLSREVTDGRRMITSVKLGHGLFSIIRTQDDARRNAQEIEQNRLMEKRRRQWQPAHIPSSSEDETDDELEEEVDLSLFMAHRDGHFSDHEHDRKEVAFSRTNTLNDDGTIATELNTTDDETPRYGTSSPSKSILTELSTFSAKKRKKKKKVDPPRPYTPCHSNINIHPDTEIREDPSKDSIFRQLCAVNWLLEAMNVDPPYAVGPILQSWNIKYKELEQNTFNKTKASKVVRDKQIDVTWKGFLTNKRDFFDKSKRFGRSFGNTLTLASAVGSLRSSPRKNSFAGVAGSLIQRTPSTLSSNQSSSTPGPVIPDNYLQDRDDVMSRVDEDAEYEKWPYDTASNVANENVEDPQALARRQRASSICSVRSIRETQTTATVKAQPRKVKPPLSQTELETRGPPSRTSERAIRTWLKSTTRQRAESAPPNAGDKVNFPSKKYGLIAVDMRHKFNDVVEDKSLVLHDKLEALEKKRLQRSEEKFKAITHKKHISEQLKVIKLAEQDPDELTEEKKRRKKQDEEIKWFQDLKNNLPPGFSADRRIIAIMDKLESIGNIESRKITPQKFLNILSGLRSWELCSPDICAAVEFVREKVVNMAVDDFEEWCQHHMPQILRAQSAPPR